MKCGVVVFIFYLLTIYAITSVSVYYNMFCFILFLCIGFETADEKICKKILKNPKYALDMSVAVCYISPPSNRGKYF